MREDLRTDLAQLIDLTGLLVWSDDENGCGIRSHTEQQKKVLADAPERLAIFSLAQHIKGAGEWLEGTDTDTSAYADAMDLPLIAFNVAAGTSEPVRQALGEIIENEAILAPWNQDTNTTALQVFDTWAQQVRALAIRLAAHNQHRYNTLAKPWTR